MGGGALRSTACALGWGHRLGLGLAGLCAAFEHFVGRFAVYRLLIYPGHQELAIKGLRWSGEMGPIWLFGASTKTRSVGQGRPLSSSRLTSASPTPSSVMAVAFRGPDCAWCRLLT